MSIARASLDRREGDVRSRKLRRSPSHAEEVHRSMCVQCSDVRVRHDPRLRRLVSLPRLQARLGGEAATFGGVPEGDFTLTSGTPKAFGYTSASGKKLERVFCPECGSRLYTQNLESFPGLVFVTIGVLDDPGAFAPALDMFTKRRLAWAKPLDGPQFEGMPG